MARIKLAMVYADDSFGRLGMAEPVSAPLRDALRGPSGLILVAGPANSGRNTTIDAAAAAARDALVASEICDRASAEEAIRMASSRLVLAPIDARHAVGVLTRLREYRIDPLSIAASLRLITAQRSARRLCPDCRVPEQADGNVSALLGFDPGTFIYAPRGCRNCEGSGYRDHVGIFEALPVEDPIRRLIAMGGDESLIASHAFRDRPSLSGAARLMARQGLIAAEDAVALSRTPVRALL